MWRVVWGFLVCAFAWPVILVMGGGLEGLMVAGMVAVFTAGASLILGLPLFFWFRERQWLTFWHCLAGGATPGVICAILFMGAGGLKALLLFGAIFGVIGAIHGALFWFVAVFRNRGLQEYEDPKSNDAG